MALIEEVAPHGALSIWRRDDGGQGIALRVTRAGLAAIGVEEASPLSLSPSSSTPPLQWDGSPLNVLLSFAQFEREMTSERIRDKIAASKRKGLWIGGMVPLGYQCRDRKVLVVEEEAERVRYIFRRCLELGSLNLLLAELRQSGVFTKIRTLSNSRTVGGIPFTRGPLAYLLRNRFYIGEIVYKGLVCPGEQPAILDRALFEAVQERLNAQPTHHVTRRTPSGALLVGRIFDDRGNRMTPAHVTRASALNPENLRSTGLRGGGNSRPEPVSSQTEP